MGEYDDDFGNVDSKLSDIKSTLDRIYFLILDECKNSQKILEEISKLKSER